MSEGGIKSLNAAKVENGRYGIRDGEEYLWSRGRSNAGPGQFSGPNRNCDVPSTFREIENSKKGTCRRQGEPDRQIDAREGGGIDGDDPRATERRDVRAIRVIKRESEGEQKFAPKQVQVFKRLRNPRINILLRQSIVTV